MARNKASTAVSNARNRQMLKEVSALRRAGLHNHHVSHYQPPASSIAERDAAYAAPRTITAEHCGDPLPGRSALDRRSC